MPVAREEKNKGTSIMKKQTYSWRKEQEGERNWGEVKR